MNNPIQDLPISYSFSFVSEHASAQRSSIERSATACICGGGGGEEEVGRCGAEVGEDFFVGGGAGADCAAGEEVGVDYGEGVGG